jgi:hypothetical protein
MNNFVWWHQVRRHEVEPSDDFHDPWLDEGPAGFRRPLPDMKF